MTTFRWSSWLPSPEWCKKSRSVHRSSILGFCSFVAGYGWFKLDLCCGQEARARPHPDGGAGGQASAALRIQFITLLMQRGMCLCDGLMSRSCLCHSPDNDDTNMQEAWLFVICQAYQTLWTYQDIKTH